MFRLWGEGRGVAVLWFVFQGLFVLNWNRAGSKSPGCFSEGSVSVVSEVFRRCWHFQPSFYFLFPQHSIGGDHNLSSVITLASEYLLPQGFRAGSGGHPACHVSAAPSGGGRGLSRKPGGGTQLYSAGGAASRRRYTCSASWEWL